MGDYVEKPITQSLSFEVYFVLFNMDGLQLLVHIMGQIVCDFITTGLVLSI